MCKEAGIDILITCTYRDNEAQDALYAKGRTVPGTIVTYAQGGDSFHNYRCAVDFVPLEHGKPDWESIALFTQCGTIAERCGLVWSGRWQGKMRELAHVQYTAGLTLKDFKNGRTLT